MDLESDNVWLPFVRREKGGERGRERMDQESGKVGFGEK